MATFGSQYVTDAYSNWTEFWEYSLSHSDPRVSDWLLMHSPLPTLQLTALYLLIVTVGPKFMRNRKPYDAKLALQLYNVALVALNLYIFVELVLNTTKAGYSYSCQRVVYSNEESELRIAKALWWYYFSKCLEFLDTIFFVIRKKNNQISFLHVYHHASMFPFWWIGVRWVAGGQSFFGATMNSFIHVLMYSYYGLASLGPEVQKYLWWKRYLTKLQLIQFVLGIIHTAQSIYVQCDFPAWMQWTLLAYAFTILSLFLNFYYQAYIKSASNKGKRVGSSNGTKDHKKKLS